MAPWTFKIKVKDNKRLVSSKKCKIIEYMKPDNKITFDKSSSVHLANIIHDDNQPCHLKLKNKRKVSVKAHLILCQLLLTLSFCQRKFLKNLLTCF